MTGAAAATWRSGRRLSARMGVVLAILCAALGAALVTASRRPGLPGDGGGPLARLTARAVDLNSADAVELASLPGVGPALAERLIEDRSVRGPYRSLSDLDRVRGVGPSLLRRLVGRAVVRGHDGAAADRASSTSGPPLEQRAPALP